MKCCRIDYCFHLFNSTMMSEGFFALCLHRYRGPDSGYLDVYPGSIVIVWRVEPSGWAGALDMDGGWGWIPFG